ncbi:MAG TPA: hypothetical protein VH481_07435 [Nitrososphaeraceae archaeon]|jgi:hypothetical protein
MILTGYKWGDRKEYVLPLDVTIPELNLSRRRMTFLVDTGSSTTTICGPDANNLDLSPLFHKKFGGAVDFQGNIMPVKSLNNCKLDYVNEDKYSVTLDVIDVVVQLEHATNTYTFMESVSLLGMDFLESFKISFKNHCVYLEK